MKKVDCDGCEYLIDCVGIWFCDKNNLPIDKFYECPNSETNFNFEGD